MTDYSKLREACHLLEKFEADPGRGGLAQAFDLTTKAIPALEAEKNAVNAQMYADHAAGKTLKEIDKLAEEFLLKVEGRLRTFCNTPGS